MGASTPTTPTDDQTAHVVRLAAAGDRSALNGLITTHGPMLYGLCCRLTQAPDDVYQAVWEHLLSRLDRFDPSRGSFRAWAKRVAHRRIIDRHRRQERRPNLTVLESVEHLALETAPDARQHLQSEQRRAQLERAIQRLPAAQARVLVRFHLHDDTLTEIAEDESVPIGTVKSRLHRARAALHRLLREKP